MLQNGYKFVFAHAKQFLAEGRDHSIVIRTSNPLFLPKYSYFIIDEVHLMDTWGRAFIREYANLRKVRSRMGNPPIIMLTATASKRMQMRLLELMGDEKIKVFVTGFYRPEIKLEVIKLINDLERTEQIKELINKTNGKTIIFVPTIKKGESLKTSLLTDFPSIQFYHGKLLKDQRLKIQKIFSDSTKSEKQVLIATSAFGMGVNIPDIRRVIHYSMPANIVDYYQQAGRAGRDRRDAWATLLYCRGDESLVDFLNNVTLDRIVDKQERSEILKQMGEEKRDMLSYINSIDKWQYILDYFGEAQSNTEVFIATLLGIILRIFIAMVSLAILAFILSLFIIAIV